MEPPAFSGKCWCVVPAAGSGSRMVSNTPKQYLPLAGATVIEHSVATLLSCDFIELVVVAHSPGDSRAATLRGLQNPRVLMVEGGKVRSDSVLAGLKALAHEASAGDWVLVHDAARPCVSSQDISSLARQVFDTGVGGILAEAVVDTIKRSDEANCVLETLEREQLWRAQTPQMFKLELLRAALENAKLQGHAVTDEASAMEWAGEGVQLVSGSSRNLKITLPEDLPLAEFYLSQRCDRSQ